MDVRKIGILTVMLGLVLSPLAVAQDEQPRFEAYRQSLGKGLDFLVSQQNDNGSWAEIPGIEEKGELGVTCLVVWSLAGGLDVVGDNESWRQAAKSGIDWILEHQEESGAFIQPGAGLTTYRTALAILVLVEAKRVGLAEYDAQVLRARNFLVTLQFSEENGLTDLKDPASSPHYGGFGYDEHEGTKPDTDMSNTQFALTALQAANLPKDHKVYQRVQKFLSRCQNRSESNDLEELDLPKPIHVGDDSGFMYDPGLGFNKSQPKQLPDGSYEIPSYASMTYAGLMSMLHAGLSKDDPRVQAAWGWIGRHYTLDENYGLGTRQDPSKAKQGLYYYYAVFARSLSAYGEPYVTSPRGEKHDWVQDLGNKLASLQHEDGHWVNTVPRWWESNPTLCTAYATRALVTALRFEASQSTGSEGK